MPVAAGRKTRFEAFELDSQTGELFKQGQRIGLHGQPIEVLALLLEHPGELITREELRQHLWPHNTFVDFEHSLNTAIKKLRQALDDDPDKPRYIETLPKKGYRFIAPVERVAHGADTVAAQVNDKSAPHGELQVLQPALPTEPPTQPKSRHRWYAVAVVLIFAIAAVALYWLYRPRTPVVTGVRQLTQTGHRKTLAGYHQPVTDGIRVYFDEFDGKRWRIGQVSAGGGDVSYLETTLIQSPWLRDISQDGSSLLVSDEGVNSPAAPNWIVPLPHGPSRRVPGIPGMSSVFSAFLPRNKGVLYCPASDLKHLVTVQLDGSAAALPVALPGAIGPSLDVSPDGTRLRFATYAAGSGSNTEMWECGVDGSGMHPFLSEHKQPMCCGHWSPDGRIFVFASGGRDLWAVTESTFLRHRRLSRPVRLTQGPIQFRSSIPSTDGKQIFAIGQTERGELSFYDPQTRDFLPYLNGISAGFTGFSRDSQWITYVSHPQGELWRSRVDGSERLQLAAPETGLILNPAWSPDGRFIVFTQYAPPNNKLYLVSADGGSRLLLLAAESQAIDPTWSPDGKSVVYGGPSVYGSSATEIRILNLETKQSTSVPGSQRMFSPRWSPDGRYIASVSDDMSRLFFYGFESASWKEVPLPKISGSPRVGWPAWSHDGRYLYWMSAVGVYRMRIPDGRAELIASMGPSELLSPATYWGGWFGLTPDDNILVLRDRGVDELYALDLEYR